MALGFLSVTIAARVISEQQLGIYFLLFAIVAVLQVIGDVGLRLSAAKFVASASSDRERQVIVNNILTFRLISLVTITLISIAAKPLLLYFFPSELLSSLFVYAPILFCVQLTEETLAYIMQGFHLYKKMAYVQVLTGALNFVLVWLFLLVMQLAVEGLLLASILSLSFAVIVRYWMIPAPKRFAFDWQLIRKIITFALPLQGNDILSLIFQRIDVLILGALMSPAYIAYLEVASKIPNNLRRLYAALHSVYFPHISELFARGQRSDAEDVLNNFLRLSAFLTTFCALVFILFQRDVILLLFSEKYLPSAPALGLLMIVASVALSSQVLDAALIAADRPAYLLIINTVMTIVSVLANVALIPLLGFMGAVYAELVANLISNPVSMWCLRREQINARWREALKPALYLVICVSIYLVLGWDTIALKLLLMVLFIALSVTFSAITGRDLQALLSSLRLPARQPALEK
jgi:O-antigen/teichoic acid export membrane protein